MTSDPRGDQTTLTLTGISGQMHNNNIRAGQGESAFDEEGVKDGCRKSDNHRANGSLAVNCRKSVREQTDNDVKHYLGYLGRLIIAPACTEGVYSMCFTEKKNPKSNKCMYYHVSMHWMQKQLHL